MRKNYSASMIYQKPGSRIHDRIQHRNNTSFRTSKKSYNQSQHVNDTCSKQIYDTCLAGEVELRVDNTIMRSLFFLVYRRFSYSTCTLIFLLLVHCLLSCMCYFLEHVTCDSFSYLHVGECCKVQ